MILNNENINAAIDFALIDNSTTTIQTYMSYDERLTEVLKIYEKRYDEFSKSKKVIYGIEKLTTFEEVALLIDVIKTVNLIPCEGMKKNNLVAFSAAMKLCEEPIIAYEQDFMVEDAEKGKSINIEQFIDSEPNSWDNFKNDFILKHSNKKESKYNRTRDYMDFVYNTYLNILADQSQNETISECEKNGHKFDDWSQKKEARYITVTPEMCARDPGWQCAPGTRTKVGEDIVYERTCQICGKVEKTDIKPKVKKRTSRKNINGC